MSFPRVLLTKITSTHEDLRTDVIEGYLYSTNPVEVGKSITVMAEPLDREMDVRCIRTSPVQRIEGDLYHTLKSTYKIEFLVRQ